MMFNKQWIGVAALRQLYSLDHGKQRPNWWVKHGAKVRDFLSRLIVIKTTSFAEKKSITGVKVNIFP